MLELNWGVDITKAKESFITAYYNGYTEAVALEEAQKGESTLLNEQVAMAYNAGKAFADAGGKFSAGVQAIVDGSVAEAKNDASDETSSIKKQLKDNLTVLNKMEAVASVTEDETFESKQDVLQWALSLFEKIKYKVTRKGFGEIIVDKKRLKSGLSYLKTDAEKIAFAAVPQVLERGTIVGTHTNHKGRNYSTVTIAAPVVINGVRGNMAVVVRQSGENYYKVHRLLMPDGSQFSFDEKRDTAETAGGVENNSGLSPTDNVSRNIIPNSSENVKKGRVVYEDSVDLSSLSDKQKTQIKYIEVVAAVTGVEIHLFQSGLNSEGMYDAPYNGKFVRETNTIYIDVNAGKQGENIGDYALTRTLSHELTHFIRTNAPREYMALMRFCFQKIGMDKFNTLVESKTANNESLDFEDAIEEVVASGIENTTSTGDTSAMRTQIWKFRLVKTI